MIFTPEPTTALSNTAALSQDYASFCVSYLEHNRLRRRILEKSLPELSTLAQEVEPHAAVQSRVKTVRSVWTKMRAAPRPSPVLDSVGVRFIVNRTLDCYRMLHRIHREYAFVPWAEDDYIASPKPNGYRSLHTAIFVPGGHVLELQIRTLKMHMDAQWGSASHRQYKEGRTLLVGRRSVPIQPPGAAFRRVRPLSK
jgi:GTP pyrophosphokinase